MESIGKGSIGTQWEPLKVIEQSTLKYVPQAFPRNGPTRDCEVTLAPEFSSEEANCNSYQYKISSLDVAVVCKGMNSSRF